MKEEISPGLIRRYLDGACTPAEAAKVREWYDSFRYNADPLTFLSSKERETLKRLMYDEVMQRLRAQDALPGGEAPLTGAGEPLASAGEPLTSAGEPLTGDRQPRIDAGQPYAGAGQPSTGDDQPNEASGRSRGVFSRSRLLLRFAGGAAAAAVAIFFGFKLFFADPETPERGGLSGDGLSAVPEVTAAEPCAEPGKTLVENKLKTILRQTLPDGSVVWLKPDTWISFPAMFAPARRELKMKGEAFFEVTPDVDRPFVVFSGDLMTRVVGTSFNIKAYGDGSPSEVSVFTGKVSVSLPDRDGRSGAGELYLIKDEKAVFRRGEKRLMKQLYSPEVQPELNIWRKNTVSFDNAPVREVVSVLNAEFDIALKVAESDRELNNYILKADFTNQNLPDILQMLERSLNLTYEINGREIILKLDK